MRYFRHLFMILALTYACGHGAKWLAGKAADLTTRRAAETEQAPAPAGAAAVKALAEAAGKGIEAITAAAKQARPLVAANLTSFDQPQRYYVASLTSAEQMQAYYTDAR